MTNADPVEDLAALDPRPYDVELGSFKQELTAASRSPPQSALTNSQFPRPTAMLAGGQPGLWDVAKAAKATTCPSRSREYRGMRGHRAVLRLDGSLQADQPSCAKKANGLALILAAILVGTAPPQSGLSLLGDTPGVEGRRHQEPARKTASKLRLKRGPEARVTRFLTRFPPGIMNGVGAGSKCRWD